MRNREISTSQLEGLVSIHEHCDIYTLAENEWSFYSKFRSSSLLRKTPKGWKITQQHGSFPDIRVQEGETMAINKIHRENLELRDAVKRHTAELENMNRELEVEAALERVRSRTMAMQSSDELTEAATEMFSQIKGLGLDPWSCGLTFLMMIKQSYHNG